MGLIRHCLSSTAFTRLNDTLASEIRRTFLDGLTTQVDRGCAFCAEHDPITQEQVETFEREQRNLAALLLTPVGHA